jgi:hypothetical protein
MAWNGRRRKQDCRRRSGRCAVAGLFLVFFLGIGASGRVFSELSDTGIGEANGAVDIVGEGLVEGAVVFPKAVEDRAKFK